MGSHLGVALGGSTLIMAAGGFGTGATYALVIGDASQVPRLVGAALVHLPAIWVLVGIACTLFGLAPRWAVLAWVGVAVGLVVAMFGVLLDLPGAGHGPLTVPAHPGGPCPGSDRAASRVPRDRRRRSHGSRLGRLSPPRHRLSRSEGPAGILGSDRAGDGARESASLGAQYAVRPRPRRSRVRRASGLRATRR